MPSRKSPPASPRTTSEQIAERAYELFLARGGHAGYHVEDWLQAERELNGHDAPTDALAATDAVKPARKRAASPRTPKA